MANTVTISKYRARTWTLLAVSGELLSAVVNKRIGGGNAMTGLQWQWGDAENVIDKWCEMFAERLSSWTSGASTPS